MSRLFDASSFVALVLDEGGEGLDPVFDERILDLTLYEAGNVFWKANTLQNRIDETDRDRFVELLEGLEGHVETTAVTELDLPRTMGIAGETELTFYDAAYVACAEARDLELVTEDGTLRDVASEYVDVTSAVE